MAENKKLVIVRIPHTNLMVIVESGTIIVQDNIEPDEFRIEDYAEGAKRFYPGEVVEVIIEEEACSRWGIIDEDYLADELALVCFLASRKVL